MKKNISSSNLKEEIFNTNFDHMYVDISNTHSRHPKIPHCCWNNYDWVKRTENMKDTNKNKIHHNFVDYLFSTDYENE